MFSCQDLGALDCQMLKVSGVQASLWPQCFLNGTAHIGAALCLCQLYLPSAACASLFGALSMFSLS
jgi:hypothetical protein